jgi:hypothetical protein
MGEQGIWAAEYRIQRRYRFVENPWMAQGMLILATRGNTDWPVKPPLFCEDDDLLILFHPDTSDEVVGRVVNGLRDQGHEVIVERSPKTCCESEG